MKSNKKNLKQTENPQSAPKAAPARPVVTPAATSAAAPAPAPGRQPAKATETKAAPAPVRSAAPAPAAVAVEFVNPNARQVFVAGTFNGWKPEATPLQKEGSGRWVARLNVPPGRHEYLFVVDGQWVPDPRAKEVVQNPFGGQNSVLSVAA